MYVCVKAKENVSEVNAKLKALQSNLDESQKKEVCMYVCMCV